MTDYAIQTDNLTRRFGSRSRAVLAVDGVSLDVPQGSVYGFLGPNGAGKTTTIRMLLGLIRPNAGHVNLFGRSLNRERLALLRRVGALVETPSLYPHLTGRENLELTRRLIGAPRSRIDRALRIVRLEDAANRLVKAYSLGMKQRLGLALALLGEPELLILDEPTNGLDPAGISEVRDLIRQFPQEYGITVFLSSHLLGEVEQVATHLSIIHRGRLLFEGILADLETHRQKHIALKVDRAAEAQEVLARAGWAAQPVNGHLRVLAQTPDDAAAINRLLVGQGVSVYHLSLEQPSLEETFLKLTGGETERSF